MALGLPVVVLLCLGTVDMAQAYRFDIDASGAARAGMLEGITSSANDIGTSIRAEPNNVIDQTTSWGLEGAGSANSCSAGSTSCGDPNGCPTTGGNSPFTGTQIACFSVQPCTEVGGSTNPYTCTPSGNWGTRPTSGQAIIVKVVIQYTPFTPLIGNFAGPSGKFYLTQTAYGLVQ
jgi:hypothetical protein